MDRPNRPTALNVAGLSLPPQHQRDKSQFHQLRSQSSLGRENISDEPSVPVANPFLDPAPLTPVHFAHLERSPLQEHPGFSSVSVASRESWGISAPPTPGFEETSARSSLVHLAPGSGSQGWFPAELPDRPETKKRGCFGRLTDKIFSHVHPKSVLHLFDFRPWFWPITPRKYAVLFLVACAIAGIIVSDHYFRWISKSLSITRSYMLPVLIISVCTEPVITFCILLVAKIPDIPEDEIDMIMEKNSLDPEKGPSEKVREPQGPFDTALVIPCHDTDEAAIKTTLDSAFPHFRPQDIFVVDNGRSRYPSHPTCNFRAYIRSIHPDIVYIWSPIGSKNAAQLVGTLAAKDYKYIMTIDDDVCVPKNWTAPTEMIDEKFKAVAYPLKGIDAECKVPLWLVAWQDVEYRLSGMSKMAEDRLCGVQYPHGAGWFVERESFLTLLEHHHPMDFIAEDCNAGLGLAKMGKGIRFDGRSYLATEVPTTFFGPGLNWWKQRQKSWEMGRHGRLFAFIRQFLFALPARKTPQGIFWHKMTYLYLLCSIAIDWLRIPTIIALGRTASWWRNAILLMLFSAIPPLLYKYWKCRRRPDMRPKFWACVTYPWYKQIYAVVAILGAVRAVGYYFGGHPRPLTIQQMLKRKDDRCFWLDPRFKANPAWLADEGEAQQEKSEEGHAPVHPGAKTQVPLMDAMLEPPMATYRSPLMSSSEESLAITPAPVQPGSPRPLVGFVPQQPSSSRTSQTAYDTPPSWSVASTPYTSMRPGMKAGSLPSHPSQTTLMGSMSPYTTPRTVPRPIKRTSDGEWEIPSERPTPGYFDEWERSQPFMATDEPVQAPLNWNENEFRQKVQHHRKISSFSGIGAPAPGQSRTYGPLA